MLPEENRITKKESFDRVFGKGRRFRGPLLLLVTCKKEQAPPKVGFIVSNQVSKKAVVRNRVKRALRQATRSVLGEILPGTQAVFVALPKAAGAKTDKIEQEARLLFRKGGVLGR